MLYDRQQMRPMFQLRIGNPGSSFAIEIARKTGIPEDVIADATNIVGQEYIDADKYLQDIVRDKRYWENKRQSIHKQEKLMESIIEQYEEEIHKLHAEKNSIILKAKEEAQELIRQSNAKIEQTIKQIKEAQAEKESTKLIRQSLSDFSKNIDKSESDNQEYIQRQMDKIRERQLRKKKNKENNSSHVNTQLKPQNLSTSPTAESNISKTDFKIGMYVRIKGQTSVGEIKKISKSSCQVAFGSILTNVKLETLEPADKPTVEKRVATFVTMQTQDDIRERKLNFRQDIDVRGMRGDEAIQAITYFIDDALVANVSKVRILHGTGSGILRTLIRQYLSTISGVVNYKDEHVQFGGAGITVVDLQ